MQSKRRSPRFILLSLLVLVGAACLAVAGLGLWNYFQSRGDGVSVPNAEILTQTTDSPSETSPGPVTDEYTVPAGQPRSIQIPRLAVEAYVQRVGVDMSNQMVAPNNIYFTGWFTGSVVPGETGVSIINGHAGGRYENGVFRYITNLQNGDGIRVQLGDHSWREFRVESITSYQTADAAKALFNDDPSIERELHLVTCDGGYNDAAQTYDKRLIIVAKRV